MHEDAACGKGCGAEPLGCLKCADAGTAPPDCPPEIEYRDGSPCDYCDTPCEVCTATDDNCECGPSLMDRPDHDHMEEVLTEREYAAADRDYGQACEECGRRRFCDNAERDCPRYKKGE